jgi:hypothetical protein
MDLSTWISIAALVLAVPLGIASNLLTNRFVAYLEQRKLIKSRKSREQVLQTYRRIKSFHNGTADKYAYYILLSTGSVLSALLASVMLNFLFQHIHGITIEPDEAIILLIATGAILIAVLLLGGIYETARQLTRFDDYKKEFEERWGPIDD